LKYDIR